MQGAGLIHHFDWRQVSREGRGEGGRGSTQAPLPAIFSGDDCQGGEDLHFFGVTGIFFLLVMMLGMIFVIVGLLYTVEFVIFVTSILCSFSNRLGIRSRYYLAV